MKRFSMVLSRVFTLSAAIFAGVLLLAPGQILAQALTPEQQAKQAELEKTYPNMQANDEYLHLSVPGNTVGQTMGVALNSKGHMFLYTRTDPQGIARGGKAAKLWEFDQNYKFVKEWGPNNYAESFAHMVRVDKDDNVWIVDEGSGMIVKFNPQGQSVFWLGRTPEAIDYLESELEVLHFAPADQKPRDIHPVGRMGYFNRETDIAWDKQGNIFVSDGYGNSRVVKISPDGHWLKAVGTWGHDQDQFVTPHGIAVDNDDNVYVADRANRRIQVYDDDLNYKRTISGVGQPWALCITTGSPQYLFDGDGGGKFYKMDLNGKVLGMMLTGQDHGEENTGDLIHAIACPSPNVVYLGSASMWDVQKLTIH